MTHWTYNETPVTEVPTGMVGFCYIIHNTTNKMSYIGRKYVTTFKRKKVKTTSSTAKHTHRTKKITSCSDWEYYCGSNKVLLNDIEKIGKENFEFKIICWCKTKGHCNYLEEWLQYKTNALLDPKFYNNSIGSRRYIALSNNETLFNYLNLPEPVLLRVEPN